MKRVIYTIAICLFATPAFCQNAEADIKQTINNLFDGMRKADTTLMRQAFAKGMVLQSIATKKDGATALTTDSADDFLKSVARPHKEIYDERITYNDIKIDGDLAMVWAPYKFYVGQTFSHCGVDVFQLMKTAQGWKIIYIVDTRRKDKCVE